MFKITLLVYWKEKMQQNQSSFVADQLRGMILLVQKLDLFLLFQLPLLPGG